MSKLSLIFVVCIVVFGSEALKLRKYYFFYSHWGETESLGTAATTGLLYQLQMIGDDDWWNEDYIVCMFY
jgi:hypothetical protein